MIDRQKVQSKLETISLCLDRLTKLQKASRDEFLGDFRCIDAAKHNLQVAIEAMIDVANHLIARRGLALPKSHAEAFGIIAREGWISASDAARFALMARFRNRLVHLYEEVSDEEVYRILHEDLGDFRSFLSAMADRLAANPS
ncbi:MAG: type VII toxin-antitoxin system HepT family RNase toxin [Betaproteobacteria bacterium]